MPETFPVISTKGHYVFARGVYRGEVCRVYSKRWRFRIWCTIGPVRICEGNAASKRLAVQECLEELEATDNLAVLTSLCKAVCGDESKSFKEGR